ncbi:MAG: multidrug transporter [Gammaproteobacteria bacterium]|nr:MAG: multidrug transporter [Gammaproteobacteria bacterium]
MYFAISLLLALITLVLVIMGLRMLWRGDWVVGWLKGNAALLIILFALGLALLGRDLMFYRQMEQDSTIATLSMKQLGDQVYRVTLAVEGETPRDFDLRGDQWQMDVRLIRWKGLMEWLGLPPAWQLDRLRGRYLTLEDESSKPQTVYDLASHEWNVDLWLWAHRSGWLPVMDAQYGSAVFLPMSDGALYSIAVGLKGLVARPLNGPALEAVEAWR